MTMKRFFGMLTAMVMTGLAFTSCVYDEDIDTSITLSGDWYGDFGMYYWTIDRRGNEIRYDSYDTDISFYPSYDYATYGKGYEVDYYKVGPYKKIYHSFNWEIRNGNIYLTYHDEREYDTVIRDYRMSSYLFTGYFDTGTSRFELKKYSDYYDWDPYWDDWGYDGWYYYGATINTRADGETSEAGTESEGGTILRFGNRFEDAK